MSSGCVVPVFEDRSVGHEIVMTLHAFWRGLTQNSCHSLDTKKDLDGLPIVSIIFALLRELLISNLPLTLFHFNLSCFITMFSVDDTTQ